MELLFFNLDIVGISVLGGSVCSLGIDIGFYVICVFEGDDDDVVNIWVFFLYYNIREDVD